MIMLRKNVAACLQTNKLKFLMKKLLYSSSAWLSYIRRWDFPLHRLSSCAPSMVNINSSIFLQRAAVRFSTSHFSFQQSLQGSEQLKHEESITKEQLFLHNILDKSRKKLEFNVDDLPVYEAKLSLLVRHGCKPYELTEYPQILSFDEEQLVIMINRLKFLRPAANISIPLLKFVKPSNSDVAAKAGIYKYLKQNSGHVNRLDVIADALCCSNDEMLHICTRNPRIIGWSPMNLVEKIKCLLRYGAQLDDIRENTHILSNIPLDTIESRAKTLSTLGLNKPLRIGIVGRSVRDFEVIVKRLKDNPQTRHFQESMEIIRQLPSQYGRSLHSVHTYKPKVDLLLASGYSPAEILANPRLLMMSVKKISAAVRYLHEHHLGIVNIKRMAHFAAHGKIASRNRRPSMRKLFASFLNCLEDDLPPFPNDFNLLLNADEIQTNIKFLIEQGFSIDSIRLVPLLLAHDPNVLRLQWDQLQTHETVAKYLKRWKEDYVKQLNLLQYFLEKETNFRHFGVTCDDDTTFEFNNQSVLEGQWFTPKYSSVASEAGDNILHKAPRHAEDYVSNLIEFHYLIGFDYETDEAIVVENASRVISS